MTSARISLAPSPLLTEFQVAPPSLLLSMPNPREPVETTSGLSGLTARGNGNAEIAGVPIAGVLSLTQLPPASMVLYIDVLFDIAYSVPGLLGLIAIRVILVMPGIGIPAPAKVQVAPPLTLLYIPLRGPT